MLLLLPLLLLLLVFVIRNAVKLLNVLAVAFSRALDGALVRHCVHGHISSGFRRSLV